ncbi:MAG TPA: hypothetical protein PLD62_11460, partial [Candidatus Cloacimonadota bacterium]|nr:hypothetical protein [Candidatus Cloacimonadota bacterium]
MNGKIEEVLSHFITSGLILAQEIITTLQEKNSKIIEVIGEPGSGKAVIFQYISEQINAENTSFYLPSQLKSNHFWELLRLLVDISDEEFEELILAADSFEINRKYNFFYFITEKLNAKHLLNEKNIIIYEARYLDQYTLDFIQYLVNYSENVVIQFVVFSHKEL